MTNREEEKRFTETPLWHTDRLGMPEKRSSHQKKKWYILSVWILFLEISLKPLSMFLESLFQNSSEEWLLCHLDLNKWTGVTERWFHTEGGTCTRPIASLGEGCHPFLLKFPSERRACVRTGANAAGAEGDCGCAARPPPRRVPFCFSAYTQMLVPKCPHCGYRLQNAEKKPKLEALQLLPAPPKPVAPGRIHFSRADCDISGESSISSCWNIFSSDCARSKHQETKADFLCSCFSPPYEGTKPPNAVELFSVSISCLSHFPPYLFFSIW